MSSLFMTWRNRRYLVLAAIAFCCAPLSEVAADLPMTGRVTSHGRPVANVTVRLQGSDQFVTTNPDGFFDLSALPVHPSDYIAVGKPGYYNNRALVGSPGPPLAIELVPIPLSDNSGYRWQDPHPDGNQKDNCGNCHTSIFREWEASGHAHSALNPVLTTMFSGKDVRGNKVPPGYTLDWSDQGNCSDCHSPIGSVAGNRDLLKPSRIESNGVTCDYCHKIQDVEPDPNFASTANIHLRRPEQSAKLLFGPFSDATFPEELPDFSFSPVYQESRFCAACHDGRFWGVPVYETYSEWRSSSYASEGRQCQSCHMKAAGTDRYFANEDKGGKPRNPTLIGSHSLMGADREEFIRSAVRMDVAAHREDNLLRVVVQVTNTGAGHHFPTGQPLRHALLVVSAANQSGQPLKLLAGETLPSWAGDLAGSAGKGFAKILITLNEYERNTRISDSNGVSAEFPAPMWRRNRILSDNRIRAHESDRSEFVFSVPPGHEAARLKVRFIYRSAYQPLAKAKGWTMQDILVAQKDTEIEMP
jgi:hypothetical protein